MERLTYEPVLFSKLVRYLHFSLTVGWRRINRLLVNVLVEANKMVAAPVGERQTYQHILVIINPVSGQNDGEKTQQYLTERLEQEGIHFEIRLTEGEGDALNWAENADNEGFDLVIAAGGDGTVMEAMSGLIKAKSQIPLAQIPGGTASLVARALTIPTDLEEALEVALTGKAVTLDVGYLSSHDRYFCLITGAGWDARLMEDAPRGLKRRIGFGAYVVSGIKNLFNFRRSTIEIDIDGTVETRRAHTVMIANIGQIESTGLALGPDIWPHDGKLDVVIAAADNLTGIVRLLWRVMTRQFGNYRDLSYVKADRISITAHPPLPVQIDGEPMGETPIVAEVVPEGARVIVPQSYSTELVLESERGNKASSGSQP